MSGPQMVPSAAGMNLVSHRCPVLWHHNDLQMSWWARTNTVKEGPPHTGNPTTSLACTSPHRPAVSTATANQLLQQIKNPVKINQSVVPRKNTLLSSHFVSSHNTRIIMGDEGLGHQPLLADGPIASGRRRGRRGLQKLVTLNSDWFVS